MEWIHGLNRALDHVEAHLGEALPPEELAGIAGCSAYHFQRIFPYLTGMSLTEYIRRRRMSRAAADLQQGQRVLDVALKYGYQSPTAFNRAFQAVHGLPPSALRQEGVVLRSIPPLRFQLTVTGAEPMEYRVETHPGFSVAGLSCPLSREIEENFAQVPQLWARAAQTDLIPRLVSLMDTPIKGILGVAACGDPDGPWRYYVSAAVSRCPEDLERFDVPAGTWAIFPGTGGPEAIQQLERRIVTEWLPTSGYEYAQGPDLEVYHSADPANMTFEVWIPVCPARSEG